MSWTDDLPTCEFSDVGINVNVKYNGKNDVIMEPIPYQDYAFNFRSDDVCLYGVFDGHDGTRAVHFAADRLPAELLLGQLNPRVSDLSIKNVLGEAFRIVERGYFESLDGDLATIASHQANVADSGLPADIAAKRYSDSFRIIKELENKIKGGTTAAIALVVNNRLFVANVGNSRCLLCRLKSSGTVECQQISKDHDISSKEEIARLRSIGLDSNVIAGISNGGKIGSSTCTRLLGDYAVKGGYRDIEYLRSAVSEPVTPDPDIVGGIAISDDDGLFLVLMSDAVYECIQEATKSKNPNLDVAKLVSHEMTCRATLAGMAQRVVDKIAHMHKQKFNHKLLSRGDMTLVVRNFTHPTGSGPLIEIKPDVQPVSVPFTAGVEVDNGPGLSLVMPTLAQQRVTMGSLPGSGGSRSSLHYTSASTSPSDDTPTNVTPVNNRPKVSDRLYSEVFSHERDDEDDFYRCDQQDSKSVDKDGRVKSYVKLDHFESAWQQFVANNPNRDSLL